LRSSGGTKIIAASGRRGTARILIDARLEARGPEGGDSRRRRNAAIARSGRRRATRARSGRIAGTDWVAGAILAAWALGQLARDATLPTALLFYVPSPVVALLLLGVALVARLRRRPALRWIAAALIPAAVALWVENRWGAPAAPAAPGRETLRVVHWNVSGGWVGSELQAREIARHEPDLVVLSEAPERVARGVAPALPGLRHASFGSLTLFARELAAGEVLERTRELQVVAVRFGWVGRSWSVLAVNLGSSLRLPRDPSLRRVTALLAERRPDLVLGDFNAPRRSRALARLPVGWRHAYDEAGTGWAATWPVPVPLLAIDQALVGPRLRAVGYRLAGTPWSDHRLQVIELVPADPG
jgi:endonuclease/exonuclease/phosphatase (EEP) superfamily protein YafD